jgi:diacylglycerol kinase family enzyme
MPYGVAALAVIDPGDVVPRRLIAITNASAGADNKPATMQRLVEVFRSEYIAASVILARSGAELATMARAAVRERPDIVVAGRGWHDQRGCR